MKKSKVETAETRKRIIETAAAEFRQKGVQATRVADVMAAAGLTHGGFYRHFDSKEHLLTEACSTVMGNMETMATDAVEGGKRAFEQYVATYLSREFHETYGKGCPFATMGSELAHADEPTRQTLTEGFETWIALIARQSPEEEASAARADAIFKLSAMVGAVTMARIVDDEAFAQEILSQATARVLGKPAKAPRKRAAATALK
jgi:TetR/AcrR family transcriptional regulator, transcriptional repressor for nem operon